MEVARWFHFHIVCRFGTPLLVRTDRGGEFAGVFRAYLRSADVQHALISTAHPRANGLVERYNGAIKKGLRRLRTSFPQAPWTDLLGEVLAGLRMLPSRLGISPFVVVYKQEPAWVGDHAGRPGMVGDLGEEGVQEELLAAQLAWWEQAEELIRNRLRSRDEAMTREYLRALPPDAPDLRFTFGAGDLVLLRPRATDKQSPRAEGPYTFVAYLRARVTAVIRADNGEVRVVSVANLLPLRGGTWDSRQAGRLLERVPRDSGAAEVAQWDSSSSSDSDISD